MISFIYLVINFNHNFKLLLCNCRTSQKHNNTTPFIRFPRRSNISHMFYTFKGYWRAHWFSTKTTLNLLKATTSSSDHQPMWVEQGCTHLLCMQTFYRCMSIWIYVLYTNMGIYARQLNYINTWTYYYYYYEIKFGAKSNGYYTSDDNKSLKNHTIYSKLLRISTFFFEFVTRCIDEISLSSFRCSFGPYGIQQTTYEWLPHLEQGPDKTH